MKDDCQGLSAELRASEQDFGGRSSAVSSAVQPRASQNGLENRFSILKTVSHHVDTALGGSSKVLEASVCAPISVQMCEHVDSR